MDQRLWQLLTQIHESVRYADGKAVALLGIQGLLIGLIIAFMKDLSVGAGLPVAPKVFLVAGIVSIGASAVFSFLCFSPRLKNSGRKSPIYFGSIAEYFREPSDYIQYINANFSTGGKTIEALAEQVHTNSIIATIKFRWVSWSTRLLVLGLICWTIFLLIEIFRGS